MTNPTKDAARTGKLSGQIKTYAVANPITAPARISFVEFGKRGNACSIFEAMSLLTSDRVRRHSVLKHRVSSLKS
jgi:hypothetical protein